MSSSILTKQTIQNCDTWTHHKVDKNRSIIGCFEKKKSQKIQEILSAEKQLKRFSSKSNSKCIGHFYLVNF